MSKQLSKQARLGLPYERKRVVRRALMHLPWRLFVRPQVTFNQSASEAIAGLETKIRKLNRRVDELAAVVQSDRGSSALAVREQLYDTEGSLRRELADLHLEIARMKNGSHGP